MSPKRDKGRKGKVPLAAQTATQPKKIPRVEETEDFWQFHPRWSFALLDRFAKVGGWKDLHPLELDNLLPRLRQWETMTWGQILAEGGRKRNHLVDVSKIIPEAQQRLKDLGLIDQEQLLSLGVSGKARIFGVLDRGIFRVLWWDPHHQICPSTQKYT